MSIRIRHCFVCRSEVEVTVSVSPENVKASQEHFFLLSHILELPDLENYLQRLKSIQAAEDVPYCSICSYRINRIRNMLERLEELEKELKYEKSKIEAEFKRNGGTLTLSSSSGENNLPAIDNLRSDIIKDLRSDSILSTLDKMKNGKIGQRSQPRQSIRLLTEKVNILNSEEAGVEGQQVSVTESWNGDQGSIVPELLLEQDVKPSEIWNDESEMADVDPLALRSIFPPTEEILPGNMEGKSDSESEDAKKALSNEHDQVQYQHPTTVSANIRRIAKGIIVSNWSNSKLKCSHCWKKFRSTKNLESHIKHVHLKLYGIRCKICNQGCRKQSDLNRHMLTHSEKKNHKCRNCGAMFKQKDSLVRHLNTLHPDQGDTVE